MKKLSALLLFTLYACQGSPAFANNYYCPTCTFQYGIIIVCLFPLFLFAIYNLTKGLKLMPIRKGSGQKVISSNIKEIMDSYKQKGTIGTSKPANKKKALKQAIAISESSARKSTGKKKSKKK